MAALNPCQANTAATNSSRTGPAAPRTIIGRKARRAARASKASSTACTLGNRFAGLAARQRSMIAANARSTPGVCRCSAGGGRLADHPPVDRQPLVQVRRPLQPIDLPGRAVRRAAGQHRVEQGPQGVDVPPGVGDRLRIALLGGHVEERAERRRLLVREPRLPEIGQPRLAVLVQQDVGRLEVAVQHPFAVGVEQPDRHVVEQRHRLGDRYLPLLIRSASDPRSRYSIT